MSSWWTHWVYWTLGQVEIPILCSVFGVVFSVMAPTIKAVLSGVGVLSNAYNLFAINLVKNVLVCHYKTDFSKADQTALSNSQLVGAIIGQVFFGALADKIGRKATFIATISMVIIGCLASMTATDGLTLSMTAQLCLWRGIVGVGVSLSE
jgi:MFS transporter, PHS family, inorganic phosphate transporter